MTPILPNRICELTGTRALAANVGLVLNTARRTSRNTATSVKHA
ncbi:hypothetical protein [Pseudomonas sp. GX19020]|nr:hypothetical protein [Pseudomonas sp. GX19020]